MLNESVLIVPIGEISSIPFDALIDAIPAKPTDPRSWSYLIHTYAIHYANSLRLQAMKGNKGSKKSSLLGFAPSFAPIGEGRRSINFCYYGRFLQKFESRTCNQQSPERSKAKPPFIGDPHQCTQLLLGSIYFRWR